MAKLTMKDATPSEELIAKAAREATVTDSAGRTITLKKPGVLAQYRLVEVLGDSSKNEVYMGMTMPLIFVSAIDGEPVPQPSTKREVEALIQRLDDHGIAAVMDGVQQNFGTPDPEADKAALKN
ncbi:MAG: hypothetical protein M0Z99_12955 [Betaproteobacteria bacterium]|nr:hypothetical protein [Betaproteobacteria bacterium]